MKRKAIKKWLGGLVPAMLACCSLAVATTTQATAVAETTYTYAFDTGVNAFEYGMELTVPAEAQYGFAKVYYNAYTSQGLTGSFQGMDANGYVALQISTEQSIAIYMTAWNNVTEFGYAYESAYFLNENNTIFNVYTNGSGIEIPAGSRGALVFPLAGFGEYNWSANDVTLFMANVYVGYAGQKVQLGSLGYYTDSTLSTMNIITLADVNSPYVIQPSVENSLSVITTKAETASYDMKTGENAFAYGKTWSVADEVADWAKVYYTPNNNLYAFDVQNGYLTVQMEALTDVAIYPTVWDNASEIGFCGTSYFVSENGMVDVNVYNIATGHIEVEQGKKGALVLPLKGFFSPSFNWSTVTLFMANVNGGAYGAQSAKLGEVGYYASATASLQNYTVNVENNVSVLQTNGQGSLEDIHYIPAEPEVPQYSYDMRTGDNAFAYGAVWSGVAQTQDNAWSKVVVDFDETVALDKENGMIAMQVEIGAAGAFAVSPSLWDGGSGESYYGGVLTFLAEDGTVTQYPAASAYLIPAGKGVLLMNMAGFANNTNWNAVSNIILTVNTAYSFGFTVKVGEVGYYATADATMQKVVTLDDVTDFAKIVAGDTVGGTNTGVLDRIANKEVSPKVRYVSVSASDDIGLIFYVELPNEATEEVTATYTIAGEEGSATVTGIYKKDKGCFAFIAKVAPKDYQKDVTLTVNDVVAGNTNVKTYAEKLASANVSEQAKALATALVEYCEAARAYFENDVVENKVAFTTDLSAHKGGQVDNEGDVSIVGATLVVDSKTMINVYFRTNVSIEDITVTGAIVSKVEGEDNLYVATVENIVAKYLDNKYTVQIGEDTVTYSALSYVYEMVNADTTSPALYNLAVALYNYNVAANTYFGV